MKHLTHRDGLSLGYSGGYIYIVALFCMIETGNNSSFTPMGSVPLLRLKYMSKIV